MKLSKKFFIISLFIFTTLSYSSFLHVVGNKLYDEAGNEVRLTGVNWFGFETGNYCPHGLWARDYKSILMQIKDLGFNCIRIPWCNAMLRASAPTGIQINAYGNDAYAKQKGIKLYPQAPEGFTGLNLDLAGLTPLQVLDKIVEEAGKLGLKIILDNHSRKADGYINETLWYTQDFSEEQWIADWVFLAERYKGNPTIVGADLNNEPHGNTGQGMKPPASWGYNVAGYGDTDWAAAAERCGNAILQVNPDWLIIVEGVEQYQNDYYWWGGNLSGVRTRRINLIKPDKLVYSPHEYGPEVYNQSWFSDPNFPNNMPNIWYNHFGFIYDDNIGHVLVGEFGIKDRTNTIAYTWFTEFMKYMGSKYSWTFWCFNPNSGDTGGILQDDWVTVNEWKMEVLKPYLAPFISTTTTSSSDRPPTVNITSPQNSTNVSGVVLIQANATDDKGITKMELYINNNKVFEVSTNTISYQWDTTSLQNSTYTIKVVAYDTANQTGQKIISVYVNNQTQQNQTFLNIVFPSENSTLSGQTTVYIQTSQDITTVSVYLNDNLVSSKSGSINFYFVLDTTLYPNGDYILKAVGVSSSTEVVKQINVKIVNVQGDELPNATIISSIPQILSDIVTIEIRFSDDKGLDSASVYLNGQFVTTINFNNQTTYSYNLTLNTKNYRNGNYNLLILVKDNSGQVSQISVPITIYNSSSQQQDQDNNQNSNTNQQTQQNKKVLLLTPNNDNKNDVVYFSANATKIVIYSKDGQEILQLSSKFWDGKDNNDKLLPAGVYLYKETTQDGKENKGTIVLLY
jgi:gliding motility-associated-like protein